MRDVPPDLAHRLHLHQQDHVLQGWESLDAMARLQLVSQLAGIDFEQIDHLYHGRDNAQPLPPIDRIRPVVMESPRQVNALELKLGHQALARGEVAVLLVAGGQGSRLGFEKPKGMFPIGPVSEKSLFHIHAEKTYALSRRYGKPIPFLVMTSPATHEDTENYFREHRYFGLGKESVYFFQQGTMPAVEIETGKLIMEKPGQVFTSPNGHGGTLTALSECGLLEEIRARGIKHLYYFQVDNPLVKIADPVFLSRHIATRSQASSKAIEKAYPKEKMGVLALIDGRCGIIEYSDMPEDLSHALDEQGQLLHRAGSPAIHIFDLEFVKEITEGTTRLPYHVARKKVPYVDENGVFHRPVHENALKFEMFIFDALPMAERTLVMQSWREEEFSPVKNAEGIDSPGTARQMMSNLAGRWLEQAGINVPRDDDGNVSVMLEISPRFALDESELAARVWPERMIESPTYFE